MYFLSCSAVNVIVDIVLAPCVIVSSEVLYSYLFFMPFQCTGLVLTCGHHFIDSRNVNYTKIQSVFFSKSGVFEFFVSVGMFWFLINKLQMYLFKDAHTVFLKITFQVNN